MPCRIRQAPMSSRIRFRIFLAAALGCLFGCSGLFAQEFLPPAPEPKTLQPAYEAIQPVVMPAPQTPRAIATHRFWDKENIALFAATAALCTADFTVTRQNLQNGGRELNPIVRIYGRSAPGLALNFSLEAAGGAGLSYFFHRSGHHRLERAVSMFNIGSSAGAVTYGMTHR
jgi:hypothetical protein